MGGPRRVRSSTTRWLLDVGHRPGPRSTTLRIAGLTVPVDSGWSAGWLAALVGDGCGMCADRGKSDNGFGVRYSEGRYADAYLQRSGQVRGYSQVIWRGRHVAEVTQLSAEEAVGFWLDVVDASRAVETVFTPVKLNLTILGNGLPHLHAHLVPRYATGDPRPNRPLPHRYLDQGRQDETQIVEDAATLTEILAGRRESESDEPVPEH